MWKNNVAKNTTGIVELTSGDVLRTADVIIGFVPQIVEEFDALKWWAAFECGSNASIES